jgi:hypothetical protein
VSSSTYAWLVIALKYLTTTTEIHTEMDATDTGSMNSGTPDSGELKADDLGSGFARISLTDIDPFDSVTADFSDVTPTASSFLVVGTGTTFIAPDMDSVTAYIRDLRPQARFEVVGRNITDISPVDSLTADCCDITPEDSRSEAGMDIIDIESIDSVTAYFSELTPEDTIFETERMDETNISLVNSVADLKPEESIFEAVCADATVIDPVTADFGGFKPEVSIFEAASMNITAMDPVNAVATVFGGLRTKESRLEAYVQSHHPAQNT